jgi:multidrug efflux pump subunit AcrA (membrane-fusion protein)
MKRSRKPFIVVLVVAIVLVIAGFSIRKATTKPAPIPRTSTVTIGDVTDTVTETGVVEPVNKIDVKSKVAGRVLAIPIQESQIVHEGQLIAEVDRSVIDPQIATAQAQLDQAKSRLEQAVAQYKLQIEQDKSAIEQAQAQLKTSVTHRDAVKAAARPQEVAQQQEAVSRAQIALEDAQRTLKRKQSLLGKGFVAQSDVDTAQVAVDTASSTLAAARQQLSLTQAGPRAEDIADAEAQVASARAQLDGARINAEEHAIRKYDIDQAQAAVEQNEHSLAQLMVSLSDTHIVSPATGIVLKKYKEQNEIVQSATTGYSDAQAILVSIGQGAQVRVGINEVDVAKLAVGQSATVTIDALPDLKLTGHVQEIAPTSSGALTETNSDSSAALAKFIVRIRLDRTEPRLRPGMSASVSITAAERHKVLTVSPEVSPDGASSGTVKVLTEPGHKQIPRAVKFGLRSDASLEVLSGLKNGDKVIIPAQEAQDRRKIDIYN